MTLGSHLIIAADPDDLALRRPPPERMPVGVSIVHPGAKAARRRWPAPRFAAVTAELAARGHRVVVAGSPAERELAVEVAGRAGLPPTAVLAGRTDVGDLAALIAHCRLVVSGDTGIGHLATGYARPSVLLFGPVTPAQVLAAVDEMDQIPVIPSGRDGSGRSERVGAPRAGT